MMKRNQLKTAVVTSIILLELIGSGYAATKTTLDTTQIEQLTGSKGTLNEDARVGYEERSMKQPLLRGANDLPRQLF
jgi:hypothetical protein